MTTTKPEAWEERFQLAIAQASPFTMMGFYKDADFSVLKSFISSERTRLAKVMVDSLPICNCAAALCPQNDYRKRLLQALKDEGIMME